MKSLVSLAAVISDVTASKHPRRGTWVNFAGYICAAGLSDPLTRYSLFFGQLQTPS